VIAAAVLVGAYAFPERGERDEQQSDDTQGENDDEELEKENHFVTLVRMADVRGELFKFPISDLRPLTSEIQSEHRNSMDIVQRF
jgi:hypothetical protein